MLTFEGDIDGPIRSWDWRLVTMGCKPNGQLNPRARSRKESITPKDQNIWSFPIQKREGHCSKYIVLSWDILKKLIKIPTDTYLPILIAWD